MREILFRGQRVVNDVWGYGSLIEYPDGDTFICGTTNFSDVLEKFEVIPKTIGQYTGLTDKNGTKIFEGDIVAQDWYDYNEPSDDSFGEVLFCGYDCSFSVLDINKDGIVPLGRCHAYHWEVEVIGNIHDNPELLKECEGE